MPEAGNASRSGGFSVGSSVPEARLVFRGSAAALPGRSDFLAAIEDTETTLHQLVVGTCRPYLSSTTVSVITNFICLNLETPNSKQTVEPISPIFT